MNYVELHIGDYDKATAHLTACEDGIYGRLLRRYYDTEAPLCADIKALQRFVRARSKDELAAVQTVLDEFFVLESDGWHHKRCDHEIRRYREKCQKARDSVSKRWAKRDAVEPQTQIDGTTDSVRNGYERITDDIHRAPVPRHQTPDTNTQDSSNPSLGGRERAPRASRRCPAGFELDDEMRAWATQNAPGVDVAAETAKFLDHTFATARTDWPATWRNWMRKAWETKPASSRQVASAPQAAWEGAA